LGVDEFGETNEGGMVMQVDGLVVESEFGAEGVE